MGFLKKLKIGDDTEIDPDDPAYIELKRYREEQMRRAGGMDRKPSVDSVDRPLDDDVISSDPELVPAEQAPPSRATVPLFTRPIPTDDYRCTQCSHMFKESWNRCPKCGGEVTLVRSGGGGDGKDTRHPTGYPASASPGVRSSPAGPGRESDPPPVGSRGNGVRVTPPSVRTDTGERVVRAKKIRHPRGTDRDEGRIGSGHQVPASRSSAIPSPRRPAPPSGRGPAPSSDHDPPDSPSRGRTAGHPQRHPGPARDDLLPERDLEALFEADPVPVDVPERQSPSPGTPHRRSWKDISTLADQPSSPRARGPPPEVRSMLDSLMDSGEIGSARGQSASGCPKCGSVNPPGDWDFCMACGAKL